MKRMATPGNRTGSSSSSRRYKYTKVLDNRKHAIRGLWRRNGSFLARITVEDDAGRKAVKWVPLDAETGAEAQEEFRTLLVERSEDGPNRSYRYRVAFQRNTVLQQFVFDGQDKLTASRTEAIQ